MSKKESRRLGSKIALYCDQKKISAKKLAILTQIETHRAQQILNREIDDFETVILQSICKKLGI